MKKYFLFLIVIFLFSTVTFAGDLYKVNINNQNDADILNSMHANPILPIQLGCIVLIPEEYSVKISETALEFELLEKNIFLNELYLQSLHDMPIIDKENVLFRNGDILLIQASQDNLSLSEKMQNHIFPVSERESKVRYIPLSSSNLLETNTIDGLDTLIEKISQDSLESYLYRLEAFNGRLTGTDSSYASRDWIENKFKEFGYSNAYIDPFTGVQLFSYTPVSSYNVIATKVGSKFPEQQIIICAHYDAVPSSPGSDDNGTGTAAVLELARVLKDVETDKTFIFIAFDSEESGLYGAHYYADNAYDNNDDIVVVLNADMIGNIGNTNSANLFTGAERGYAYLWNDLSDSLVNITGSLGSSSSSDHFPFQVNGYDVVFVHEGIFSSVYHSPLDSTSYVDFGYMTRMTKGTLATAYTVSQLPPPVKNVQIEQPGDGTSLYVHWDSLSSLHISHYNIYYYKSSAPSLVDSQQVSYSYTYKMINGLEEGSEYRFYVKAFDYNGNTAVVYDILTATPNSIPLNPENMQAFPNLHLIELIWAKNNKELDFNHYNLYRDSAFLVELLDTFYIDNSPSLGIDLHEYYVVAVDNDGNQSPAELSERVISRTAVLEPSRILAINRSSFIPNQMVDAAETGKFMREALEGYNFDYYSDSAYLRFINEKDHYLINNWLDYGIVIIGAETGGSDDIAMSDINVNLSEILSYYLSIGGKAILFGRWARALSNESVEIYNDNSPSYIQIYPNYFDISSRVSTAYTATFIAPNLLVSAKLIGAKSQQDGYPELSWDSALTDQHNDEYTISNGIPITDYVTFNSPDVEVIYTYDSNEPGSQFEDKPVAWKNTVGPYKYVCYDIPLSFFERTQAITALRTSVLDLMQTPTDINETDLTSLPQTIQLAQNYPNPFNPSTTIEFSLSEKEHVALFVYNIIGQKVSTIIDEIYPAGNHKVKWDGTDSDGNKVSSGIYLYKIVGENFSVSKKMVLLK